MSLIVVQRGHVPRTSGATGTRGEQAYSIEAADRVASRVHEIGHQVRIINADVPDSYYRGDMFVALHWDGSANPGVRGASVGYQTPEGQQFASAWKRHYAQNGWTGGFRADNYTSALGGYYGVKRAVAQGNRRAFISEAGFQSNPEDMALLASPEGPDRVAIAVAGAITDILGAQCPPGAPQPPGIPAFPGTVRMGDRGHAVAVWQHELVYRRGYQLVVDGVFGAATNHVVWHFQSTHGLVADCVAGPATWHALLFA